MSKGIKKIAGIAAPFVSFIPGIGLPAAIALGAGLGGISGGLRGALAGGLGAGALGGGGAILGKALGVSGAAGSALGTGLLGAGAGAATNGLKGALIGGAGGALGGYATGGGFGNLAGTTLDTASGVGGLQGPTQGTGLAGSITRNLGGAGAKLSGALAGGGSSYSPVTSIASGLIGTSTNDDAEDQLLEQQRRASALYEPYLNDTFDAGDFTADPGYQFRLQQGEQALGRRQSASGNYFSGEALKATEDYGQGLADQTYQDSFNRWLAQRQSNLGAAGAAAGVYDNIGNIQANSTINNGNVLSQSLSGLLGGNASNNTGALMGGNSDMASLLASLTPDQIASLRARNPSLLAGYA